MSLWLSVRPDVRGRLRQIAWAAVAALGLLASPAVYGQAGEYVLLKNGQRMRADRHDIAGNSVRLYRGEGFVELPAALVAGYEPATAVAAGSQAPALSMEDLPAEPVPVTAKPVSSDPRTLIQQAARDQGLPPAFVESVARIESAFRPDAISPKGAIGVMQLMPETAARLGADPHDLEQNIAAGTRLLRELLQRYDGDVAKALAAYNAGEGAVDRYHGIPPYRETQDYVNKVVRAYIQAGGE